MAPMEILGWILFLVGFIVTSIFGLGVPDWKTIPHANLAFIILLLGEGIVISGIHDKIRAGFGQEEEKKYSGKSMMELGIGGIAVLGCLIVIFTGVKPTSQWHWLFVGAVVALGGAGLLGIPHPPATREEEEKSGHPSPYKVVEQIIASLNGIDFDSMDRNSIKKAIEEIELNMLIPIADNRHHYSRDFGVERFAQFFSLFSSGEMYINRAWSSLVDGYPDESKHSVEKAGNYFRECHETLNSFNRHGE